MTPISVSLQFPRSVSLRVSFEWVGVVCLSVPPPNLKVCTSNGYETKIMRNKSAAAGVLSLGLEFGVHDHQNFMVHYKLTTIYSF